MDTEPETVDIARDFIVTLTFTTPPGVQLAPPDLRDRLTAERYAGRKNRINLCFKPSEFPVSRGETVAWSGNSGTSFGPHLHFEISDTKS